jgi:hypothetical protein
VIALFARHFVKQPGNGGPNPRKHFEGLCGKNREASLGLPWNGEFENCFHFGCNNAQFSRLRTHRACVNLLVVKSQPLLEAMHLKGVFHFMVNISDKAEKVLLEYFKGKEISPIRIFLQSGG